MGDGRSRCFATLPNGLQTALHIAAGAGAVEAVGELLKHGANVHAVTSNQAQPLHFAAQKGAWAVIDILLGAGADVAALVPVELVLVSSARITQFEGCWLPSTAVPVASTYWPAPEPALASTTTLKPSLAAIPEPVVTVKPICVDVHAVPTVPAAPTVSPVGSITVKAVVLVKFTR